MKTLSLNGELPSYQNRGTSISQIIKSTTFYYLRYRSTLNAERSGVVHQTFLRFMTNLEKFNMYYLPTKYKILRKESLTKRTSTTLVLTIYTNTVFRSPVLSLLDLTNYWGRKNVGFLWSPDTFAVKQKFSNDC